MKFLDGKRSALSAAAAIVFVAAGIAVRVTVAVAQGWQLPAAPPTPTLEQRQPARSCEGLSGSRLAQNVEIREARVTPGERGASDWCRVTIAVTSPPALNVVTVWLGLPIKNWNGRFLGLGGGGWLPGFPDALKAGVPLGFATAITNAGRPYDLSVPAETLAGMIGRDDFLLNAKGRLDWNEFENFAYRGIHEMTVVGKAITAQFYGHEPRYSYFSGCSTGGRQGQSEVQRYPSDYNGVLSGSPVINWAHFAAADSWAITVTNELGPVAQCKFDAARRAAVAACDADDGVRDGLVSGTCNFDARALVGTPTNCGVIDVHDAEVIERIWDGPPRRDGSPLWYGLDRTALIHTPTSAEIAAARSSIFGWNGGTGIPSIRGFERAFDEFVQEYGPVMDTSNPDLSRFADRGGKTILWHGIADEIIPAAGSVHYVDTVRRTLGAQRTNSFLRLYLAPGVDHCGGGGGPQPVGLLEPLMDWVEHGLAPQALLAKQLDPGGHVVRTRPLCPYPQQVRYNGNGSIDDATSFGCR